MKSLYNNLGDKSVIDESDVTEANRILCTINKHNICKELSLASPIHKKSALDIIKMIADREVGYISEHFIQVKPILRWAKMYCGVQL